MFLHMSPPISASWVTPASDPEQPEGVVPVVLPKTRNTPELGQRLQRSRRDNTAHVRTLPAQVFQQSGHDGFGSTIVAAEKHGGRTAGQERVHHEVAAYAIERFHERNAGVRLLQSL